jgi:hypothetical protein
MFQEPVPQSEQELTNRPYSIDSSAGESREAHLRFSCLLLNFSRTTYMVSVSTALLHNSWDFRNCRSRCKRLGERCLGDSL